jgi:hypothetical protein
LELPVAIAGRRALLFVGHPGHELYVHGWLEQARPLVWVLTDGSGHGERGRLPSTRRLLGRAGASPGEIFGRLSDRDAYAVLLNGDVARVSALVYELAAGLIEERVDYVVGDACEGFSPVHDLCRLILDAAAILASGRSGRRIDGFEFALAGGPEWRGAGEELAWDLDDAALARKLAAASRYSELAAEVEHAVAAHGTEAFRRERLFRVEPLLTLSGRFDDRPDYERFGEERVAAGVYTEVLRYRQHFAPLVEHITALVRA